MDKRSERKRKIALEEISIVTGLIVAGAALQLFTGEGWSFNGYFDNRSLAFPANLILIALLLLITLIKRGRVLRRLASGSLSIILLTALALSALWMGLIPGSRAKVSWPFVFIYLSLMINLIALITERVKSKQFRSNPLTLRNIAFLLNHLSLLMILFAAGPGAADKRRLFMQVREETIEWRAEERGELVELPLAIELKNFTIDEYPPKLAIVDKYSGEPIPKGRGILKEAIEGKSFKIEEWNISVDSFSYKPRFAPSAYLLVTQKGSGEQFEGWISCGNIFQSHKLLDLTDTLALAMTFPEAQSYRSEIKVYRPDRESKNGVVSVNHPMRVGSWMIYQHSYDTTRGRDSEWSIFELVYDPWVLLTYIGFYLLMAGSITLFWKGGRR